MLFPIIRTSAEINIFMEKERISQFSSKPTCKASDKVCSETNSAITSRALDKRRYLLIIEGYFSYFLLKPYVVTPHLNRLVETVQMRGHNICFYAELTKTIPDYQILPLI